MNLTRKIILGAIGGFLLGNALWDVLGLNPEVSVIVGAGAIYLAVRA